jgi:hypothetical protein
MMGALGVEAVVVARRAARGFGVMTVELVPGREMGEGVVCELFVSRSARSAAFLLLEEGRGGVCCSGCPMARPTAATPTVLEATSCPRIALAR